MTTLQPMTEADYPPWRTQSIADYAQEKQRSGQWDAADADKQAQAAFAELLPAGLHTPGHHLYTIVDATGTSVGAIWIARQEQPCGPVAFIYDLVVWPAHRRQGHGEAAMRALEHEVLRLGFAGLALHVFGHNEVARALYARLGYAPTNIHMFKPLAEPDPPPGRPPAAGA